jgi:hypothetical protein
MFIMLLNPEQLKLQITRGAGVNPRSTTRIVCQDVETCAISYWLVRAARLGSVIESVSGRDVAIDAYTPCIEPGVRESASHVTVRVHARFPPELEATVPFVPIDENPRNIARAPYRLSITLLKWVAVGLDSEFVVCFDLDMDVFLPALEPVVDAVAREWLDVFERMKRVKASLASLPDHSAPINAGFMLLRPNRTLYHEGVALLRRANTSFSEARGWELLGEPLAVVPIADSMGWQDARNQNRPTLGWIKTAKRWTFVGAPLDQGFFFHMCAAPAPPAPERPAPRMRLLDKRLTAPLVALRARRRLSGTASDTSGHMESTSIACRRCPLARNASEQPSQAWARSTSWCTCSTSRSNPTCAP